MAKIQGKIIVNTEKCKGCGVCVASCPFNVLQLNVSVNSMGYNYVYMAHEQDCTGCASCAIVCPDSCITVYREKKQA